jgi:hypothetical protein
MLLQIRHATSPTISGYYTPAEAVMQPFAHNAFLMDATMTPGGGPYLLLHIGAGTQVRGAHVGCNDVLCNVATIAAQQSSALDQLFH